VRARPEPRQVTGAHGLCAGKPSDCAPAITHGQAYLNLAGASQDPGPTRGVRVSG